MLPASSRQGWDRALVCCPKPQRMDQRTNGRASIHFRSSITSQMVCNHHTLGESKALMDAV